MTITTSDRQQISETLALHAHIVDEDQLERLEELFTPEAVYDMSASGMGAFEGMGAIRTAATRLAASGRGPTAHFVTNTVITEQPEGTVSAHSKALMIMRDGSLHTVIYDDVLRVHEGRWLISRRVISPAGPAASPAANREEGPAPTSAAAPQAH